VKNKSIIQRKFDLFILKKLNYLKKKIKNMFANRKIDNFFNKKKRSTLDHSQKKGKEHLILSESSFSKQTLTKIGIEKQLLNFDLDSQYGPAYGIFFK